MAVDVGTLTDILDKFQSVFTFGREAIGPDAKSLLSKLTALEVVLAALFWAMEANDFRADALRKLLKIGLFTWFVLSFDSIIKTVFDGFTYIGFKAGGSNVTGGINDPSGIVSMGFDATKPLFVHIQHYTGAWDVLGNLNDIIITGLCAVLVLLAFFIIAIQVFVTQIEFGIFATLGLILIPFGVFKHTSFLAEKVFGGIISFGVKLMVLAFLIAVTSPFLSQFNFVPNPNSWNWDPLFSMVVAVAAIAYLSWHAPAVAAGIISGGPSLTAGSAAGTALAGAMGLAGGAMAASAAGSALRGGIGAATNAGAHAMGAVRTAAGMGAATAGGGTINQAMGAVRGVATAAGSGMAQAAKAPLDKASGAIKESYQRGAQGGFAATGGAASDGMKAATAAASGTSEQKPEWAQKLQGAHMVTQAIPAESHPSGGMAAPIKAE